ncbi:hypothetical protein R1flu_018770 [Riccia fluitans]|uniref:Zinc-finger domain-containing protein n=1 Tax=Riccia fluitans TaxID=41844 RepID=A0ABD1ZGS2_9MARC
MAVKRKVEDDSALQSRSSETGKKNRVDVETEEVGDENAVTIGAENPEEDIQKQEDSMALSDDEESGLDESEELEEERRKYEEERNRILEENKKRMLELGLPDLSQHLSPSYRTKANMKSGLQARQKKNQMKQVALQIGFIPRRSARGEGRKAPDYRDIIKVKVEPKEYSPRIRRVKSPLAPREEEGYTEEHLKSLGTYTKEWELFQDGYSADGVRIYDSVRGKTCHQCRQKTMGRRTWCSSCNSLSGQFCGDCLFMRYGENVLEANANPKWTCPGCRGICNCSICRMRKGWAPTGNLFRYALSEGFRSVAHYLVMTRQRKVELKKVEEGIEDQLEGEKGDHKEIGLLEYVNVEQGENGHLECAEGNQKANGHLECVKAEPEEIGSLECVKAKPEEIGSLECVKIEQGEKHQFVCAKGVEKGTGHQPEPVEEHQSRKSEPECVKADPGVQSPFECKKGGEGVKNEVICLDDTAEICDQSRNAKDDDSLGKKLSGRSKKVNGQLAVSQVSTSLSCGVETISGRLRRKETINYKRFL